MDEILTARLVIEEVEAAGCRLVWGDDGRPHLRGDRSRISPTLWAVLTRWRRDEVAALLAPAGLGAAVPHRARPLRASAGGTSPGGTLQGSPPADPGGRGGAASGAAARGGSPPADPVERQEPEPAPPVGLTDDQLDALAEKAFSDGWPPGPAVLLEVEPGRWLAVDPEHLEAVRRHNEAARAAFLKANPGWA